MTNTRTIFKGISKYLSDKEAAQQKYDEAVSKLDPKSKSYNEDVEAAQKVRTEETAAAKATCSASIEPAFDAMDEANGRREYDAPTPKEIRVLNVVSMMRHPSKQFLDSVSNSLRGCIARAALDDIAAQTEIKTDYAETAKSELSYASAASAIQALKKNCETILKGGDPVNPYQGESDFILREVGIDPELFMQAVN